MAALAVGAREFGARADDRAALGRIDRVEHHKARIVDPAVRVDEALAERALQGLADHVMGEIEHLRAGQDVASAEMVVEEQPEPQHPGRPQP